MNSLGKSATKGRRQNRWLATLGGLVVMAAGLMMASSAPAQSPSEYLIYVSNEYSADITVIDPATNRVVATIPISGRPGDVRPRGMAVSPDGHTIYVAVSDFNPQFESPEDKILGIDVGDNQGEPVVELRAGGNPERLALTPDATEIWATLEATARVGAYNLLTGEQFGTFITGVESEGVAISPDAHWVYVTSESTHVVTIVDRTTMTVSKRLLVGNRPRVVEFSPDGAYAYVSAEIGGTISVIDTATQEVVATVNLGLDSRPVEIAVDPTQPRIFVAGGGTSAVYVINTETYEVTDIIRAQMGRRPWGIAITPDGKTVYTANGLSDSISIIDTGCMCVVNNITAGRGPHSVELGVRPQ